MAATASTKALLDAIVDCINSGASSATDPVDTANRIWIGRHGQTTLLVSMPWHPWPADRARFADDILTQLAQLDPLGPRPARCEGVDGPTIQSPYRPAS